MTRILIASACLLSASTASATTPVTYSFDIPPTARISVADVDIGSALGRAVVERRIERAAERVCVDAWGDQIAAQPMARYSGCYRVAVASGRSQLEKLAAN